MDIALMSVLMNQSAVQSAASISVAKLAMNSGVEMAATQISDIMNSNNMAVDTSKGTNIDIKA